MPDSNFPRHAIAVVGLAGRFPGSPGLDGFWSDVRAGFEALEEFSDADLRESGVPDALAADPRYVKKGTVLPESRSFDATFFGFSPREAQVLDPQHRIFLECAWEAMEHAGYGPGSHDAVVGVYGAASMNSYLLTRLGRDPELLEAAGGYQIMLGNDKDFLCTRASYKLDLKGPSMTVQTACSSSLVAVEAACRALVDGECEMALAGGVSLNFPERAGYLFQEGMIFSPDGHCRPFDARAGGTRAGAGAGIVALKRLADAQRDGDTIHAVIRGIAINNDGGAKAGYTAPSLDGQVEVIATAQALAEVDPRSISYVEAHGTATPLGDPIEIAALTRAFRAGTEDIGFCSLGSLKANLGHLDAAAGIAGLIKTVLVLKHGEIPPLVNFETPNPALNLDSSPFRASAKGRAWEDNDAPRRAAVSSFGIGGTNAHAVLEQAPEIHETGEQAGWQLLPISAKNETALAEMGERLGQYIASRAPALGDVAWTLQNGRSTFAHRRYVVADSTRSASEKLTQASGSVVHEGGQRKVAFLFSGQGAQHPGMGEALYHDQSVYRACIDRCAELLHEELQLDLRDAMFGGDAELLRDTRIAQPALFVTEIALAEQLAAWGVEPAGMIGHSIGEFAAATLAGVFTLEDALKIVALRGRLMSGLPAGAMAAVMLPEQELPHHLAPGVEIAAVNAPSLCTIAGPSDAVARTIADLEAIGVVARPLHTSHAFHSAMMEPILDEFRASVALLQLKRPQRRYVSSLTGDWITDEQATSPDYYADQLRRPVRFAAGLATLASDETLFLLELGPGTALGQLANQNLSLSRAPRIQSALPAASSEASASASLLEAVGAMWAAGVPVDFRAMHGPTRRRRIPLPTYPFQREVFDAKISAAHSGAPASAQQDPRPLSVPQLSVPIWSRHPPLRQREKGHWLVCGADDAHRQSVEGALRDTGMTSEGLTSYGEIAALLATEQSELVDGVILLDGLGALSAREHFDRIVGLAQQFTTFDRSRPLQLLIATERTQSVLDERAADPQSSLLLGATLVFPTEMPWLGARVVDVADEASFAETLAREAGIDDHEPLVAWRGGRRWLRSFAPLGAASPPPVREGGVYLITGGLGGIGLALAGALARRWKAKLLLTSRSGITASASREQVQAIREIEEAGGEAIAAAADVADEASMRAAIEEAKQRWGRIDGVIHAAGVTGTGKIVGRLEKQDIDATLSPKVGGLLVLKEILGGDHLDFLALLGSINAVIGAVGTFDYSAANAVLDGFAESGIHPAGWERVVAVDFTAWSSVGMARDLEKAGRRAPQEGDLRDAISTEEGIRAFFAALGSGADRVVAAAFDLRGSVDAARVSETGKPLQVGPAVTLAATSGGHNARDLPGGQPEPGREQRIAEIWVELIGVEAVGRDDNFFALGGHSLLATRLLSRIRDSEKSQLQLRHIFENPTLREFAAYVDAQDVTSEAAASGEDDREEMVF